MSITWNGVSSDTIGVIVERIPNRYVPTRRFSPQQVAGRNGNILLVDKSFPNVEQEYEVYLSAESQGLPSVARACAEWLMGPDGYCRLQDSYDTTVYREAFLMGGYDLENILNKFGRCTITFSCKPQKYLLTGDTPISIPAGPTTYTGDVVQFDGVTGASITSLSTTISPIQDLHGYSSPWPAGGGVNKYPNCVINGSQNGLIVSHDAGNERYNISAGTVLGYAQIISGETFTLSAGTYYWHVDYSSGSVLAGLAPQLWSTDGLTTYATPNTSFTISADTELKPRITCQANVTIPSNFSVRLAIVSGSTAPTLWTPYSNICPISGRTGLSVYVGPTQDQQDATTYSVDWTSPAGTVYHGTVDPVIGQLTVDWVLKSFDGTEGWGLINSAYFMTVLGSTDSIVNDSAICSHYLDNPNISTGNGQTGIRCYNRSASPYNGAVFLVRPDAPLSMSLADFKTWLATENTNGTPLQVCYELATPLTYQLTAQEVAALVGENNVWTSSGPVSVTVEAPFSGIVTNPTPFEARPMLEVSGVGEITINGKSIHILESVSDFEIDCEAMEAEDNSKIYCMDFPELSGGENEIIGDSSITSLMVVPRWWTL